MTDTDSRISELGRRYRASLPVKRASVERAWHALRDDGRDPRKREALRLIVHRIAGSAPSYGYPRIGAMALAIEIQLDRLPAADEGTASPGLTVAAANELATLVGRLLDAMAHAELAHDGAAGEA